jgi:hypothetical protein
MIDVVVMAHPKRDTQAIDLADQLGAYVVWDEQNDEWDTGFRSWCAIRPDADWGLVVQDDALPIDGMRRHAEQALTISPRTAVSFYVGTGRPRPDRVKTAVRQAQRHGASWLESESLLWGVAVALPQEHIPAMLDWAQTSRLPYDQRISAYYRRVLQLPVRYTWPSLTDHADGDSLVGYCNRAHVDRHAHQLGTPERWDGPVIHL